MMEDLELMMKVIVVGDGRVKYLIVLKSFLIIDWKNMFNNKICEEYFP